MAVARMKKVHIYAHCSMRSRLVEALQEQGKLHIENLYSRIASAEPGLCRAEELDTRELTVRISKAAFVDQFLARYQVEKPGFIQGLFKEKFEFTSQEYFSIEKELDFDGLYEECESLDAELFRIGERLKRIEELVTELEHWRAFTLPLAEAAPTPSVGVLMGKVAARKVEDLKHALEEATPLVHFAELSRDVVNARVMVICHREVLEEVEDLLASYDFTPVELAEVKGPPAEEIKALEAERKNLLAHREELVKRAEELSDRRPRVVLYHEYLVNERKKREIVGDFAHTAKAFAVEGWIREADEDALRELLRSIGSEVEVEISEPTPEDRPPTITEQPGWRKPFWLLTRLYGYPDYREFDPTAAMTPFFVVFFGMCLGDFGYGVVFSLICWQMRKRLVVSPKIKDFLKLLIYAGVSAAVFGVLGGSYFGIKFDSLPSFLQKAAVLLPIESEKTGQGGPMPFLYLALGLGALQLVTGYVIELVDNMRNGRVKDAVYDQVSVLGLIAGIGLTALGALLSLPVASWCGAILAAAAGVLMVATGGRESRSIFGKLANGLFALYGTVTGLLGDTLSYVRLFALGLATTLVAFVVNDIGRQLLGIPLLGYLLLAVVAVAGHAFNLGMSFLGAFVHPLRLQYVEFFSKFYDNGARPYDPFRIFSKRIIFKDREYLY